MGHFSPNLGSKCRQLVNGHVAQRCSGNEKSFHLVFQELIVGIKLHAFN